MALQPDRTYQGAVLSGSLMMSKAKKTPGFQIVIEADNGERIDHTIWITAKNKERASADFQTLGVDVARLASRSYIENELPTAVIGREVEFGTKAEEYNGREYVRVSWLSPVGAADASGLAAEVASIFGGKPPSTTDDDSVPF